ncbi:acyl carrier protein [Actinomadura decatromicini]|uniref:Acyl carrier protein n=1 Tax=Actinomadura decatromicini TaxID=2604572 RepID=A0A5D3F509_9ACTN|nr:acyl carrier protein [Actinomadura decatromicini]TYK44087.1 acyl carrier protein [Actinomadura decatromicini]
MSKTISLDDLRRLLVQCAGEATDVDLTGDIIDTDFEEIGYDSLALMETGARLESVYGVVIPDDDIAELKTPRALLDRVNQTLVEAS